MPSYRTGTVTSLLAERPGLQRVEVDGEKAYVLTQLIGPVTVGDRVVMNTTAVELGLGTGGWHVVHWNLSRDGWSEAGRGHVMKLRYTSLQADTGATEESGDRFPLQLEGMPVVACALHSQIAYVAAAVRALAPAAHVIYVMTDGGALPLALSDLVHDLRKEAFLHSTVTAGHAFGGDREAVNVHSALTVAHQAGADVVIAGIGPGAVGTGTALGHSGVDVAVIVDAAAALGGEPIVAARYSDADPRDRHRGISHHTEAALRLTARKPLVPSPDEVELPDVVAMLAAHGLRVTSMGRGPEDDPGFWRWAAAAGVAAARHIKPS